MGSAQEQFGVFCDSHVRAKSCGVVAGVLIEYENSWQRCLPYLNFYANGTFSGDRRFCLETDPQSIVGYLKQHSVAKFNESWRGKFCTHYLVADFSLAIRRHSNDAVSRQHDVDERGARKLPGLHQRLAGQERHRGLADAAGDQPPGQQPRKEEGKKLGHLHFPEPRPHEAQDDGEDGQAIMAAVRAVDDALAP